MVFRFKPFRNLGRQIGGLSSRVGSTINRGFNDLGRDISRNIVPVANTILNDVVPVTSQVLDIYGNVAPALALGATATGFGAPVGAGILATGTAAKAGSKGLNEVSKVNKEIRRIAR